MWHVLLPSRGAYIQRVRSTSVADRQDAARIVVDDLDEISKRRSRRSCVEDQIDRTVQNPSYPIARPLPYDVTVAPRSRKRPAKVSLDGAITRAPRMSAILTTANSTLVPAP